MLRVLLILLLFPSIALGIPGTSTRQQETNLEEQNPQSQDVNELIEQAENYLTEGHPIDARAKLTQAIKAAPEDYRAYLKLGQYYLFDISHFKLAIRYIKTAEEKFEKAFGKEEQIPPEDRPQHAIILYMLSEAELNLDRYQDSLNTLERFEKSYWMDWLPGSKSWVLMKMERVDEAIQVARLGLMRGAEPRRTWNILGILLSMKGERETSLEAFRQAIIAEMATSGLAATPLNNAGEVYRELYRDAEAESAWLIALKMSDGCDHILPSLNLAHAYIEQLRLFQAERVLKDFEACFALQAEREDSEHRTLLALARGKIALRKNDLESAGKLFEIALADQQWFGKIGTNENDVRLASLTSMAELLSAKKSALNDKAFYSIKAMAISKIESLVFTFKAWWMRRLARKLAVNEMNDFEDLYLRNTDSMLEYPSLGDLLAGFDQDSMQARINRLLKDDDRTPAYPQYKTYLAINLLNHGSTAKALELLKETSLNFKPYERFQMVESLAYQLEALKSSKYFWQSESLEEIKQNKSLTEQVYRLLPSAIRFHNLKLPVRLVTTDGELAQSAQKHLTNTRFEIVSEDLSPKFQLSIVEQNGELNLQLLDLEKNFIISSKTEKLDSKDKKYYELLNSFIEDAFSYKTDFPQLPLPAKLSVMENAS